MWEKAKILGAFNCDLVEYVGGHKAFAQQHSEIFFYEDRFDIGAGISVKYSKIMLI